MTREVAIAVVGDAQIVDFVGSARERLTVVCPAVVEPIAKAIIERAKVLPRGAVAVILDIDPEVYRLGYGNSDALVMLEEASAHLGISLRRQPGLRLCIIIADSETLIFSPTPKLIEAGLNTSGGANAIYLASTPRILEQELTPAEGRPKVGAEPLSSKSVEDVRRDLEENPPQKFDIARRMRVFNSYYEFVELELTGVHIDRRQIRIPEHLMGVANPETRARLRSHFQLVAENSKLSGDHLRKDRDLISRRFLKNVPNFGNLVRRADKDKLQEAVEQLRQSVQTFKTKLEAELQASIDRSREELTKALLPGVARRPPKEWFFSDGRKPDRDMCRQFVSEDLAKAFGRAGQWRRRYCDRSRRQRSLAPTRGPRVHGRNPFVCA